VRSDRKRKPCVDIGSSFPSWLPMFCKLIAVEAVLVLLRWSEYLGRMEAFVGNKYVI
jgi:hypothetical protein